MLHLYASAGKRATGAMTVGGGSVRTDHLLRFCQYEVVNYHQLYEPVVAYC